MKKIIKVFALTEIEVIESVQLCSHGLSTETISATVRLHQGDFETELEALKFIDEFDGQEEHGFEIIHTFVKN
tara:strand:+ start:7464 stop:7682 length:219 start_codon:yes stop_codon:yes gene_type:complete